MLTDQQKPQAKYPALYLGVQQQWVAQALRGAELITVLDVDKAQAEMTLDKLMARGSR